MKKVKKILLLSLCVLYAVSVFAMKRYPGMACCKGHFDEYIQCRIDYINSRIVFIKNNHDCKIVAYKEWLENIEDVAKEMLCIKNNWDEEKEKLVWYASYDEIKPYKKKIDGVFHRGNH